MFDWDEYNLDHIARHGVDPIEAEDAVSDPDRVSFPARPRRIGFIGVTEAGRVLVVILDRNRGVARSNGPGRKPEREEILQEATAMNDKKSPVRNLSEVPGLATEKEAREFWDTHEITEEYLESAGPSTEEDLPPAQPRTTRTKPIAVRFDEDVLERLKQLADHKHKGYQTLLKEFVSERLYEEEKREGILK